MPRIRMITPVWGQSYIDRWLGFSFASLRSPGNIPYLNQRYDFELAIITKAADAEYMRSSPRFKAAMEGISVKFILMDEFFPASGKTSYGVPLTLAFAKAILDLGPEAIGTYVFMMNADIALADGSLRGVANRIDEGYTIITAQAIRAIDGPARSELNSWVDQSSGILSIRPRQLMRIINQNLHSTITAQLINEPTIVDSTYYHQMFWRVSDDCIAMKAFLIHPLCFRIERISEKIICPVDYGFITEFAPNGRYCAMSNSDDYLMIELQEANSEAHLLRVAPDDPSFKQRLARLQREISAHAQTWTTAEHRRSVDQTFLYHEKDLPLDVVERVAPFEAFVDGISSRLKAPMSHIRHFQWLPAVRIYREEMAAEGAAPPALLDDPRNDENPHLAAAS